MAGASKALDPIAAAEAGIAGSKDLIAAVARDLGQHQRWLAHYDVAEKRHARRVMLQNILWQLEWARRRLKCRLERFGVRALRLAHLAARLMAESLVMVAAALNRAAIATVAWLSPRAHALYRAFARFLAAAWAWAVATSRALARAAMRYAAAASVWLGLHARMFANLVQQRLAAARTWTLRESRRLWHASVPAALAAALWMKVQARTATIVLRDWLSTGAGKTVAGMQTLTRAASANASAGLSWARRARKEWLRSYATGPTAKLAETNRRALVVRRPTALIFFEAKRTGLPALRPG